MQTNARKTLYLLDSRGQCIIQRLLCWENGRNCKPNELSNARSLMQEGRLDTQSNDIHR